MNDQTIIPQINTEKQDLRQYKLKTGFTILRDQRNKILDMPLKDCKLSVNQSTGEATIDVGQFMKNRRELIDYLICLFFEGQNGETVNLDTISDQEYKLCEEKLKEMNPFGVFNITAF